jgi:hypothetical protein
VPQERVAEIERVCRVPYSTWIRQGFIETTAGNGIDMRAVKQRIHRGRELFELRALSAALHGRDGLAGTNGRRAAPRATIAGSRGQRPECFRCDRSACFPVPPLESGRSQPQDLAVT